MAKIKKISFASVGRMEGCTCDKCGQYLQNIYTVEYQDGLRLNYGIECFRKLYHGGNLSDFGKKLMTKTLKSIVKHQEGFEREKTLTEETDTAWKPTQEHYEWKSDDYWYGRPWEEYHKWMLEEWWPARFAEDQKQLDRFAKVNFER